jgi:hypothetical protein
MKQRSPLQLPISVVATLTLATACVSQGKYDELEQK